MMKAFWKIKRIKGLLWVKMYTDCKGAYYAASRPILFNKGKDIQREARSAFSEFTQSIKSI